MASSSLWQRFQRYFLQYHDLGLSRDISRMKFPDHLFEKMRPQIERALEAMRKSEAGAIANPTEYRMVGHYWLRSPALAPTPQVRSTMGLRAAIILRDFCASRSALYEKGRELITMSIPEVNAFYNGALTALYERAVGFYGSLVISMRRINQASKRIRKWRANFCSSRSKCGEELSGEGKTAEEIAHSIDADPKAVFHLLRHLASNDRRINVAAGG